MAISFNPIGTINTPFKTKEGMPIQSKGAEGIRGLIVVYDEYLLGLKDLEGFSHIILIYNFHLSKRFNLETIPFLDNKPHGIFATRSPERPNQIGFSVVKLISVENNILVIENADIIDGTPLLDIKPYIPDFDSWKAEKCGWYDTIDFNINHVQSDKRFK